MNSADKATPLTILVIEDNHDQRELLQIVLQKEGYRVITAKDGMEALEKLEKEPPQLVISDIMMPRMNGFELVRRLRSNPDFKNIYLILITALFQEKDRVQGLDLGADDYITKPFFPSELLARVRVGARVAHYQLNLQQQALRDALTGLFNRRAFEKKIDEEFERAKRYRRPLSLLILDIDNFKMINDKYGHHQGDEVLKWIGQNLRSTVRRSDFPSRYGGEEFVVILSEIDLEDAFQVGKKICDGIKEYAFGAAARPFTITVSIGVSSTSREEYSHWDKMLKDADQALYIAKNNGKDRVEVFVSQNTTMPKGEEVSAKGLAQAHD